MSQPMPDRAEVALEYPDKSYVGTFEHSSSFEAHLESTGLALTLERRGSEDVRKSIHMHLNYGLLAAILRDIAASIEMIPPDDMLHRDQLGEAVEALREALAKSELPNA